MPAGRVQKSRSPNDVPDLGDPDRKRVLNVLAQRRYRQRRKEKIATLEAQAKSLESLVDHTSSSSDGTSPSTSLAPEVPEHIDRTLSVPGVDGVSDFIINGNPFDASLIEEIDAFPLHPTPQSSTSDFIDFHRSPSSPSFAFPLTADGGTLSIPIMSVVQALMSIATALDLTEKLWDPTNMHVMPASASYATFLPANLHPVPAQMMIPHHPAIDIIPWPTMREKLILTLAMPSKMRPPVVREDDDEESSIFDVRQSSGQTVGQSRAITQLVQDLDDLQEGGGIRVHGNAVAWGQGNEFVEEAWEVGETFYRKWWFCLDQKIVNQSNAWRKARGLGRLRLIA
ncbi:hypothetical protein SVAN01_02595 [Stagonosporopsis vannaccii]|nr:hypothetical protein SVAN01_02595 [Stagonosporopsis vannaccii]